MNYFDQLTDLLQAEQQYDKEQHEALLLKSNLSERRAQGVTWFPISISNSELGRGDYLSITVSKTNHLEEGHKFRFGMPVSLFSNHSPHEDRIDGLIAFVNRDTMRISFKVDELPDWSRRGKLGVDLLFDENSYKEMHAGLRQAQALQSDNQEGALIRQLLGEDQMIQPPVSNNYQHPDLNDSQNHAIRHILSNSPLAILHGPPGTGKTTTLIHAVQALLKQDHKQILLVAPSNTAVDLLTERLDALGISVVRMGNPVRISEHIQALTLDEKVDKHAANKEAKTLEKQARAYSELAHKYKRSFGKLEREQRKALFDEARKLRKEIDRIQDYIVADVLNRVEVITATLVGANHYAIRERGYETIIIDEAAQALEPACWLPILKGKKVILAGDHCQLPPTVKSSHQSGEGLYVTLFEKLVDRFPAHVSLLDVQYRMHTHIMAFPSRMLYQNRLQAAASVSSWTLINDRAPLLFIDTAGAGFEEIQEDTVIFNKEEAQFLKGHLCQLQAVLSANYDPALLPSIGVIAPYRGQALLLKDLLKQEESLATYPLPIQINTIDSFQGQEKDIIYISLTRSNAQQQIGFLADVRRMNVAMTRARKKLIIIGDSSTIGQHPFYKDLLIYVEQVNGYHSVWEWDFFQL